MVCAYIALGTNVGDRPSYLYQALLLLDGHEQIRLTGLSSIYETVPVGYTEQRQFLNMTAEMVTELTPTELFVTIADVENQLGRRRTIRWGPRRIDIDILLYNQKKIETKDLQIPHPRMTQRAFVLIPLAETNPALTIPGYASLPTLIEKTPDKEGVHLWKSNYGEGRFGPFEN